MVKSDTSKLEDKLLIEVLQKLNDNEVFPYLSLFHALDTSYGIDNHYLLLVHLISRSYELCMIMMVIT